MVYSASSQLATDRMNGDAYFYLKRQALFCGLGLSALAVFRFIPCRLYIKLAYPMLGVSLFLLAVLLIPGVGKTVGGACRWLRVGFVSVQPSELAKFSLALFMAYSMSKKGQDMTRFTRGLLPHLVIAAIFMMLIVVQPDLGTPVIIGCWMLILLFVAGVRFYQLLGLVLLSFPVLVWLIARADYRMKRWWAFIDPWEDPQGIGYQIVHSFLAFGSGGILGVGLGDSKQKLWYLPEPHTDFILPIVGEELGLVGITAVLFLFGMLIYRGVRVALQARDLYSTYLAFGLISFIGLQAIINMGVVMGLLPTTGLTLPFMSYGGSSLVINLVSVGILLNISVQR
jgi:cell division protein FtsW